MPRPIRRRPGFDNDCPEFKTPLPVLESHRPGFETACPAFGHRCPGLECRRPDFQDTCPGYDGHCPDFFQLCPDFLTLAPDLKGLAPISNQAAPVLEVSAAELFPINQEAKRPGKLKFMDSWVPYSASPFARLFRNQKLNTQN